MDFWISEWISGFQIGFLDFTVDFWISVWISFVTDPSQSTEYDLGDLRTRNDLGDKVPVGDKMMQLVTFHNITKLAACDNLVDR